MSELESKIKAVADARKALEQAEVSLNGEIVSSSQKALGVGVYRVNNSWFVVRLAFDPVTGEGKVEDTIPVEDKSMASERFKIEAASWLACFNE